MYQQHSLSLILFVLFTAATCEIYYIIPSQDVQCPANFCLTLSEISSNTSYYIDSTNMTTLTFQPGNYSLDEQLKISNIPSLRMLSNEVSSTNIVCKPSARLIISDVITIEISALKFIGCGRSSFIRANNVTMWNSIFEGVDGRNTAIVLNNTAAATIEHCLFIFNTHGKNNLVTNVVHFDASNSVGFDFQHNATSAQFGGAILVLSSFTVIENSLFEGNQAQYGGAIHADINSSIVINHCTFQHNRAVGLPFDFGTVCGGGGALFVKDSKVDIYNSTFINNTLIIENPGCYTNGGVLFAFNSEISAIESNFFSNALVTGNGRGGVIYASNTSLLTMTHCTFRGNRAQIAGVMHLQSSNASITQCEFYSNIGYDWTGVISITENSYTEFENSSFADNSARTLGGVLYIASSKVIIDKSYFVNNSVDGVGAVMVILEDSDVIVSSSTLYRNRANLAVMSVYNSNAVFSSTNMFVDNHGSLLAFNSTIKLKGGTTFSNCTTVTTDLRDAILQEGGAISIFSSNLNFQSNTLFVHNSANYGGALFAVESTIVLSGPLQNFQEPKITITNNTATNAGGGIYLYHSYLTIQEGYLFIVGNNATDKGGGVQAVNSDIKLEIQDGDKKHSLVLAENRAELGGGLHFEGASKLSITQSVNSIRLTENIADYGAAIYVDDNTKFDTCFTTSLNATPASECFVNVFDPYKVSQTMPHAINFEHITIDNNHSEQSRSDLFGGLLDRCRPKTLSSDIGTTLLSGTIVQRETDGLTFFQNISNIKDTKSISSHPMKVCFCIDGRQNCNLRERNVQIRKGEFFSIPLVAVDQAETPVASRIFSSLYSNESALISGRRVRIEDTCTDVTYSILSPYVSERISLFADGPCRDAIPSQLMITILFSPCTCPIGFQHSANDTSCECVCDPLISEHVMNCNAENQTFVRKTSSWINYVVENNESTYIVCQRCPFRYCQGPSDSIEINLNNKLGADVQCTKGHMGTICGVCAPNFSVSLAHKRCLPCPNNWYFAFIGVCAGTILAGLGLVISILAINFTVAVGTINGFIFYANIVDVYDSTFLPLSTSSFPVLIIEWLNLDPGFDICFVKGIDLYGHTWVRLIFPAYIIVIIIIIIVVSERSIRFSKLIAKKNPISTLATLLYLSFTNILETAVVALRPITLTYINSKGSRQQTVWLPDGDLKYLQGKHIPMFLVALILVLLTVAYIFLLLSWQWVIGFSKLWILKWTKNQKLQSFMEAYHAPYCEKHRYWTGLLLLVRVLLILISISTEGNGSNIPLLSTIFFLGIIFLLKMTYAKKLYKKWPVEILETAMIFNLFVYTIFTWFYLDEIETRRIIAYISTTITFLSILCVIAYHIYVFILIAAFPKLRINGMTRLRALTIQHVTIQPSINFEARDRVDSGMEDRFYEMVGTTSMTSASRSTARIVQARVVNRHLEAPTFSVLETPYISAEEERDTETSLVEITTDLSSDNN